MVPISEAELTAALKRHGRLVRGSVAGASFSRAPVDGVMSNLFQVDLEYSAEAEGNPPDHCLVKIVDPGLFALGTNEVAFYRFAGRRRLPALVECFGTLVDEGSRSAFLLLEHVDAPGVSSEWPVPPALDACHRIVRTLAEIHAHWWAGDEVQRMGSTRVLPETDPGKLAPRMQALFDRLGDGLSGARRGLIETVVGGYPEIHSARLASSGRQTLVHGDAHPWNFLMPADPDRSCLLLDWQVWGIDFGTADLAYLMALHWFPERRRRFERSLVESWGQALADRDINVDPASAWEDYRFSAAGLLARVVVYSAVIPAAIWWPHLERAFLAFDDLDCRSFFD